MSKNWIPSKYKMVRYEIQQDNITIAYGYDKLTGLFLSVW